MVPKSRLDEVLAKQKALQKQLDESNAANKQVLENAPEYDFTTRELEYQNLVLDGEAEKAVELRNEIRNAEKEQFMFEVQSKMGETVQQSQENTALQAKALELQTSFPQLDENSDVYNAEVTQEVMDLRDAFMIQGFTGADALDKAAKYVVAPISQAQQSVPSINPQTKVAQEKRKTATVAKKLGRKYYGIEKDKKYFKAAYDRISKTKIIEEDCLDTIENNRSKPRIPFGSLVELGILKPGTVLFDPKNKFNAKIMVDGSIKHKESEGSIHKIAAKIMGTESFNGWTYWHCKVGNSMVLIDSLRQRFLSKNI